MLNKLKQKKGILKAKKQGKYTGGKTTFGINTTNVQDAINQFKNRKENHLSVAKIARLHHMSSMTLYRKVKQAKGYHQEKRYGSVMSIHNNKALAIKLLPVLIHNSGHLFTQLNTTFINTTNILENNHLSWEISPDDVEIVLHLKEALNYILNYNGKVSLFLYHKINQFVAYDSKDPGYFSYEPMDINGVTRWHPPLPSRKRAKHLINHYTNLNISYAKRAIELMLEFDRYQFFWDGNKRTSWLASNYYLIQHGAGLINIDPKKKSYWNKLLFDFYNSGNLKPITIWTLKNGLVTHY